MGQDTRFVLEIPKLTGLFDEPENATLLALAETRGLIPSHIAYRHELNAAEQTNILRGQAWALTHKRDVLTEPFLKSLHKHMLGDVWRWAGKYRKTECNLGILYWEIPLEVRKLLDDTRTWIECSTFPPDEIAVRFHHRLVFIHPFPNGNGRHSRLMADLLVMQMGGSRFSWGRESLRDAGEMRRKYISALQAADKHEVEALVSFARH